MGIPEPQNVEREDGKALTLLFYHRQSFRTPSVNGCLDSGNRILCMLPIPQFVARISDTARRCVRSRSVRTRSVRTQSAYTRSVRPALRLAVVPMVVFLLIYLLLSLSARLRAESVAVGTNTLYWLSATPNAGVEWAASERFSLALSFGYNAFNFPDRTNSAGNPANPKLHHWSAMPEGRLWLRHTFEGSYFGLHLLGGQFNAGGLPFPRFFRDHRYEGYALGAGLSYGYVWRLGRDWRIGASAGLGWIRLDYDKYNCGSCGTRLGHRVRNLAGVTKAALTIQYVIPSGRKVAEVDRVAEVANIAEVAEIAEVADAAPASAHADTLASDSTQSASTSTIVIPDTLRFAVRYAVDRAEVVAARLDSLLAPVSGREIVAVSVDGFASPEYNARHNLALSGKRARGVAGLVARALSIPDSLVTVTAHGDDWEGLVDLAQQKYGSGIGSGIGSEIRSILSRTSDPAERKAALCRLDGYRRLLAEVYPALRRTEVTIIYF